MQVDDEIDREWHVLAVLVEFEEEFRPVTNRENKAAKWFDIEAIPSMKLMEGFAKTF